MSNSVEIDRSRLMERCSLNGCTQEFKLDTGSSESILTEGMVRDIRRAKLSKTSQKPKDYGYNVIKFVEETTLNVEIKITIKQHTFLVVTDHLSQLFGRY